MRQLVKMVQSRLKAAANPAKAGPMAAYMKTDMPFYGVQKPGRVVIFKEICKVHQPQTRDEYTRGVTALWELPHREEKYLAIQLAMASPQFITKASIPMYRRMIKQGAWWDFVDELAIRLVSVVLRTQRAAMKPVIEKWIDDRDMWIRRTALICHITHREETDEKQLFRHCLARADETEFFIRKAIGWTLRDYAKVKPQAVRRFLLRHRDRLSGLSFREAGKHLDINRAGPNR